MTTNADQLIEALQQTEGKGVVIFNNSLPNSRFALKSGKECIFLNGEYATHNEAEVREIMDEIDTGNPHLFIDPKKLIIPKADLDPVEAMRRKIIAEYVAAQADIQAGQAQYGTTDVSKLNIASSTDVAAVAAGSTSGATAPAGTAKIVVGSKA